MKSYTEKWEARKEAKVYKNGFWYYQDGTPSMKPSRILREGDMKEPCPYCHSSMQRKFIFFRGDRCINEQCPNHYGEVEE